MDFWSKLPDRFFIGYVERFAEGWQKHNVLYVIFLSVSLILAFDVYKTLPNAVMSEDKVYLPIGLFILLAFIVRYRFSSTRNIKKNKINLAIGIAWVLSIIYAYYLEMHFILRYLANFDLSINYALSLIFFLIPFVGPFLGGNSLEQREKTKSNLLAKAKGA